MDRMCDMCGMRHATTFTSYTINGVTTRQYLCSECAKKYNIAMNFSPDNIIASVFGLGDEPAPRTLRVCKVCGATEQDILNNYKFGCSECYKTFGDIARDITGRMGAGRHVGKRPLGVSAEPSGTTATQGAKKRPPKKPISKAEQLRRELRQAVDEERFEDAARIKKQLDAMKAEGDGIDG